MDRTITVDLGDYTRDKGIELNWVPGFMIRAQVEQDEVVISANVAGLRSLAQHLLTLADLSVPTGTHVHLTPGQELEDECISLVLQRED